VSRTEIATKALVLATIVAIVVGGFSLIPHIRAERFTPVLLDPPTNYEPSGIVVHISGAVASPGLYMVDASTSLGDILGLAQAEHADTQHSLSLIIDATPGASASQRVHLNHADAWLLDALPGIGPDRAQAIVDYREQHGPFSSTQELLMVPGLGSSTYEGLKEFVTVTA